MLNRFLALILLLGSPITIFGQLDSNLSKISNIYIETVSTKVDKYYSNLTSKTEKTLQKLARWEDKIHTILKKASPETAQQLFGNNQLTFTTLLQKYKEGKSVADGYKASYDDYRDRLTNSIKYIDERKDKLNKSVVGSITKTKEGVRKLNSQIENTEAIKQFIKERKKQLFQQALKFLGRNKYIQRINKEAYYYAETLNNYKEIFSDSRKMEETAIALLQKIPAFNEFLQQNSTFNSLFNPSSGMGTAGTTNYSALGYQSNAMISQELQQRGLGSSSTITGLTQAGGSSINSPLQQLKNQFTSLSSTDDLPDFKPNPMKSKTFKQRIEFGTNFQFGKAVNLLPNTANLGIQLAYKLNSKSSAGLGTSYIIGMGSGFNNIKFSSEGISFRSFIDWKLKGKIYVNGGLEYSYNSSFQGLRELPQLNHRDISLWKPSALIGLSKKYNIGKMKGSMLLLYDFFGKQKAPHTQSLIFRVGYNF